MAILKAKPDAISDSDHTLNRIFPVTAKLTKEERGRVTEFARSQGLARGEWIRDVILREMRGGSASDPSLAEILGVRLLLVNVLRPLASGQDSRRRRSTNCSMKSAIRNTNSPASWLILQEGNRQWR